MPIQVLEQFVNSLLEQPDSLWPRMPRGCGPKNLLKCQLKKLVVQNFWPALVGQLCTNKGVHFPDGFLFSYFCAVCLVYCASCFARSWAVECCSDSKMLIR